MFIRSFFIVLAFASTPFVAFAQGGETNQPLPDRQPRLICLDESGGIAEKSFDDVREAGSTIAALCPEGTVPFGEIMPAKRDTGGKGASATIQLKARVLPPSGDASDKEGADE